ncbi:MULTISPECIES: amino acid permease [Vitreoscilla]|uniref:Amino acid permease n=1 Tax=Vitreoscilla stercoraria TaxID=61 RepID=A0ABY4EA61_VITST|nr:MULTISPECIES: amino acid permease [Vitreoscilla]AUZ05991.1 amino acid permease [Vitreoscilla sp. C1]UOO92636.1 amino acid permease [Vitreoscilla stercoraria]
MSGSSQLQGGLKSRHLTMLSIAGVIGAGLFVGSGKVIANAGPAAILAYLGGGILVVLVMRMLGEMAVAQPDSGSFSTYADRAIGRWAGFTIGWLYWSFWSLLMGWEAYVAGAILNQWFPIIPLWGYMTIVTVALMCVNFLPVKSYGEFEFWFALVKVVAIVAFIIIGSLAIVNLWPLGDAVGGFTHLTSQGFMPNGFDAVVVALLGAMFAFIGAEIVTVAAAESQNPSKEIIRTTRSVVWRISLFYVGSIFIVVCLIPYTDPGLKLSTEGTYAVTLKALGIPYANTIVNFVVLTSVCSCFNSALYTSSRMLFSLSRRGDAPKAFQILGQSSKAPYIGVLASTVLAFITIVLTATDRMDVFDVLMAATGSIALLVYLCIAVSQLNMRRKLDASGKEVVLKMWLFPWLTYAVIFVIIASLITMVVEGTYRTEVVYTSIFGGILIVIGALAQKYGWGREQREKLEHEQAQVRLQAAKQES